MLDHFAISPLGGPFGGRAVLRVLAYKPRLGLPGLRVRIQSCTPCGEPIAEDPLLALEGVDPAEVQKMVEVSQLEGWIFFPFSPSTFPGHGYHIGVPGRTA